jgi:alpha-soluble NSF attachment protein
VILVSVITGASYKSVDPSVAIDKYQSAISLLCDAGRLMQAAKLSKQVAELFENDEGTAEEADVDTQRRITLAIENYEQAAELYGTEQSKSQQSQCLAKVAELCSAGLDPPELIRAAQLYDQLGRQCLETNLLKFNAKGYFLQSVLCHLANGDSIGASQAITRYENLDYTFSEAREGNFAAKLIESVENFDPEGFATVCFEFDRISKLDPWKTSMLVKVKRSIDGQDGGDDDDEVDLT